MVTVPASDGGASDIAGPLVVLSANSAWNIANFRSGLIRQLQASGYRVVAVAGVDQHAETIEALGAEFRSIRLRGSGTSMFEDLRLFFDYLRLFKQLRPDFYLGFTIKPNIYGSLAAHLLGIKVVNNISGLGTTFIRSTPLTVLIGLLYRLGLRKSAKVFFHNRHDLELFVGQGIVRRNQTGLIPGSGVDLQRFTPPAKRSKGKGPFHFLFVGRLLKDKGIGEYVEAARMVRRKWPDVRFQILGFAGADNPTAVPPEEVERWRSEAIVEYLGESNDVRPFLAHADCIVLPSYREGLSRTLLEASAMARPMIASDVAGCREVLEVGETGYLCEPRSARSLAEAMEKMLRTDPADRDAMGRRARIKAEREFDEALVGRAYLEALQA